MESRETPMVQSSIAFHSFQQIGASIYAGNSEFVNSSSVCTAKSRLLPLGADLAIRLFIKAHAGHFSTFTTNRENDWENNRTP
jgi:hypothetical protein